MLKSILCDQCSEHFTKFTTEEQYGLSIRLCNKCAEFNKDSWAKYFDRYGYSHLIKGHFIGTRCFHARVYRRTFPRSFLQEKVCLFWKQMGYYC